MVNDRLQKIRKLHAFTGAKLPDCKSALEKASGDFFQASCNLISYEQFQEMQSSYIVREFGGLTIKNPITPEEASIMQRLKEHFSKHQLGRFHHVGFAYRALPSKLFKDSEQVKKLIAPQSLLWITQVWNNLGENLANEERVEPQNLNIELFHQHESCLVSVITLPPVKFIGEVNFIGIELHGNIGHELDDVSSWRYFLIKVCFPSDLNKFSLRITEIINFNSDGHYNEFPDIDVVGTYPSPENICSVIYDLHSQTAQQKN